MTVEEVEAMKADAEKIIAMYEALCEDETASEVVRETAFIKVQLTAIHLNITVIAEKLDALSDVMLSLFRGAGFLSNQEDEE